MRRMVNQNVDSGGAPAVEKQKFLRANTLHSRIGKLKIIETESLRRRRLNWEICYSRAPAHVNGSGKQWFNWFAEHHYKNEWERIEEVLKGVLLRGKEERGAITHSLRHCTFLPAESAQRRKFFSMCIWMRLRVISIWWLTNGKGYIVQVPESNSLWRKLLSSRKHLLKCWYQFENIHRKEQIIKKIVFTLLRLYIGLQYLFPQ